MVKQLHKGDETHRRWKIIDASRTLDVTLLPQLLARLESNESCENKRHIVRALGKIGGAKVETKLLDLLGSERGLILGDVAHALGQVGAHLAIPTLMTMRDHESEWVRQNVIFALRKLKEET